MAKAAEIEELSFEAALARLESIVHKLETGGATLDESIALYSEGVSLRQLCETRLRDAQMKIEKLQIGPGGQVVGSTPFEAA
jgi:exodeoxyribonuclease VII small subunit